MSFDSHRNPENYEGDEKPRAFSAEQEAIIARLVSEEVPNITESENWQATIIPSDSPEVNPKLNY